MGSEGPRGRCLGWGQGWEGDHLLWSESFLEEPKKPGRDIPWGQETGIDIPGSSFSLGQGEGPPQDPGTQQLGCG